jgi:hypothetical protein
MGQIVNCEYVCGYINRKWGLSIVPVAGTEKQAANMEYVLRMVDLANSKLSTPTNYGTGSYATKQAADTVAANACINNLIVVKKYVVSGSGGFVYSENGVTWTAQASGGDWSAIGYGNNTWVGVAEPWRAVAYGNGRWVAVGDGKIAYGPNGVTWIELDVLGDWYGVVYSNGRWVAVGDGKVAVSTNGANWVIQDVGGGNWRCVAYGNGTWVMGGYNGKIAYSTITTGLSWTIKTLSGYWNGVAYGNNRFVMMSGDTIFAYSADGVNWTQKQGSAGWLGVAYGNGQFVAVANANRIAYSPEGIIWELKTLGGAVTDFTGVAARP